MKHIIKKLKTLESNIPSNLYLACYNNLNHILNRCYYDKYLIKFINRCCKYNIKLFYKSFNNYYIFKLEDVISQIIKLKQLVLKNHIDNINQIINNNVNINMDDYVSFNIDNININKSLINNYDKLSNLAIIIFHFKLLEKEPTIYEIKNEDHNTEYNNLVNLGNLSNYNLSYANKGVIIIDQYSS